jgi:hypothetical protein
VKPVVSVVVGVGCIRYIYSHAVARSESAHSRCIAVSRERS